MNYYVDDLIISHESPELDPGETWNKTWDFSEQYDVTRDNHSVSIGTTGPDLETTVQKDFDLSDPDIPAQRIADVDLVETTNEDGDPIAQAAITFENPSTHANLGEVFVHTKETHGSGELALVPIGEEEATAYVDLNDDPDSTIEGEIRYNAQGINQDHGVRDQMWFRGEVDGDVTFQRQEFEAVGYAGDDDAYRYDDPPLIVQYIPPYRYIAAGVMIAGIVLIAGARRYWSR
ncbi:hypothetical protein ACFQL3_09990 [Natronoarchaeum sp. GCM10025321]|uniref:hypothetical protein n=1 Tax=Natronoarchaeum sp. GCM10025321 TaxID=3252684 RepID=UPI00361A4DE4